MLQFECLLCSHELIYERGVKISLGAADEIVRLAGADVVGGQLFNAEGFVFNNQTGDGIYHVSNGKLGVTTAGYGRIVIDGNKIGLSQIETPECNVHIGQLSGDSTILLEASSTAGNSAEIKFGESGTTSNRGRIAYLSGAGNRFMNFETNGSERMRIDSSGQVGIGTVSPATALEVQSASNTSIRIDNEDDSTATLVFHNTGSTDRQISVTAGEMKFGGSSDEQMRIDSSGNVGIGETSPGAKLHVEDTVQKEMTAMVG